MYNSIQAEKIGYGYVRKIQTVIKIQKILERIGELTTYNQQIFDNGSVVLYPLEKIEKAYNLDNSTLSKYFKGSILPLKHIIPEIENKSMKCIFISEYQMRVIKEFRGVKEMINTFDTTTKRIAKIILS